MKADRGSKSQNVYRFVKKMQMRRIIGKAKRPVRKAKLASTPRAFNEADLCKIHQGDARILASMLSDKSVDVTITSPPYFDLKDYGVLNQIGFGQNYSDYLDDLAKIFSEIHRATRNNGSLWIIIDTFRRDQEVLPLPFDLASRIKAVGWTLRDIIIWKKERTLPWIHEGKTKKIFEYILVFGKEGQSFRYFPDKLRNTTELKRWWVKYPERYNPKGKALEEIWDFDIPTQGSWGKENVRHFCPLPGELVGRIIELTTQKGRVVLDPFAGSGTVPTQAILRQRKYIGFELNRSYITKFKSLARSELKKKRSKRISSKFEIAEFEKLILDLRVLKFARILHKELMRKKLADSGLKVLVRRMRITPKQAHKLCTAEFTVLAKGASRLKLQKMESVIAAICRKRPLSKFGVHEQIVFKTRETVLPAGWKKTPVFVYSQSNSHKFRSRLSLTDALRSEFAVLSKISVNVEEPDA